MQTSTPKASATAFLVAPQGRGGSTSLDAIGARHLGFFAAGAVLYVDRDRLRLDSRVAIVAALVMLPLLFQSRFSETASGTLGLYVLLTFGTSRLPLVASWGEPTGPTGSTSAPGPSSNSS